MGACWSGSSAGSDNVETEHYYSIVGEEDLLAKAAARAVDPDAFRYTLLFIPRSGPLTEGAMNMIIQDAGKFGSNEKKFYVVPRGSHGMVFTNKAALGTSTERFIVLNIDPNFPGGLPKKPDGETMKEAYIRIEDLRALDECADPFAHGNSKQD